MITFFTGILLVVFIALLMYWLVEELEAPFRDKPSSNEQLWKRVVKGQKYRTMK